MTGRRSSWMVRLGCSLVLAGLFTEARPAVAQPQVECHRQEGIDEAPTPSITASEVEANPTPANLKSFALEGALVQTLPAVVEINQFSTELTLTNFGPPRATSGSARSRGPIPSWLTGWSTTAEPRVREPATAPISRLGSRVRPKPTGVLAYPFPSEGSRSRLLASKGLISLRLMLCWSGFGIPFRGTLYA